MKKVHGVTKNVGELLRSEKFDIGYFQREYAWSEKNVCELVDDLLESFFEKYKTGDERSKVDTYGHYFLGSVIISDEDGRKVIIDGQQRLTTLTLILIYIYHQIDDEDKGSLHDLILSRKYGKHSFNLDVEERTDCMDALFKGNEFDEKGQPESVVNILQRYRDIEKHRLGKMNDKTLLCFTDWLLHKVHLVEITSYSDVDAYTIFETMNERGLQLTPTDKLRGYLLSKMEPEVRERVNRVWHSHILDLRKNEGIKSLLYYDEAAHFIRNLLLSQFAETFSEEDTANVWAFEKLPVNPFGSSSDAEQDDTDFSMIGQGDFSSWVRKHREDRLNLTSSSSFARFIEEYFVFFSKWYLYISGTANTPVDESDVIYLMSSSNLLMPNYLLFFTPLCCGERNEESLRKIRIVAKYIDILVARGSWDQGAAMYGYGLGTSPQLIIDARRKPAPELADLLIQRLQTEKGAFASNNALRSDGWNRMALRGLLARIMRYVEINSKRESQYKEYVKGDGDDWQYEIEHILPKNPQEQDGDFEGRAEYRNYIGSLLLLPKSINASLGAKSYAEKREHYLKQNLFAQSLHEKAYQNNPGFCRFNTRLYKDIGYKFKPYSVFDKNAILERQELYRAIAKKIWDPETLRLELEN